MSLQQAQPGRGQRSSEEVDGASASDWQPVGGASASDRPVEISEEELKSNVSHVQPSASGGVCNAATERTGLLQSSPVGSSEHRYTSPIVAAESSAAAASPQSPSAVSISSSYIMSIKAWLMEIKVPVYVLVMFFAVASWVDINGLWVEVPLLVNELPEGWNLPSYLVIIIQIANIGPLTYTIANRLFPNTVKEWPVVYIIITIGALSCLLLAFFWDFTTMIGGEEHSTALLSLSTSLALVDCTSSVVFLPYMSIFKPQYMTGYYIGEGLSGLIPGLAGLIQGVGGDPICTNSSQIVTNSTTGENHTEWVIVPEYPAPRFSVEVFFFFLFALICLSGMCFTFLNFAPFCKQETITNTFSYDVSSESSKEEDWYSKAEENKTVSAAVDEHQYSKLELQDASGEQRDSAIVGTSNVHLTTTIVPENRDNDGKDPSKPGLKSGQYIFLLIMTAWVNGLTNGVLPSTQSFSTMPYSNLVYSLSVRLGTVANPLACFVALLLPTSSLVVVAVLSSLGTIMSGYQLYLAAMSPVPPLQGEVMGEVLCIGTFVLLTGCFSYIKVTIASMLQREGGRRALLWCGVFTQIGSFVGAIITFILVNILAVFESTYPCS